MAGEVDAVAEERVCRPDDVLLDHFAPGTIHQDEPGAHRVASRRRIELKNHTDGAVLPAEGPAQVGGVEACAAVEAVRQNDVADLQAVRAEFRHLQLLLLFQQGDSLCVEQFKTPAVAAGLEIETQGLRPGDAARVGQVEAMHRHGIAESGIGRQLAFGIVDEQLDLETRPPAGSVEFDESEHIVGHLEIGIDADLGLFFRDE